MDAPFRKRRDRREHHYRGLKLNDHCSVERRLHQRHNVAIIARYFIAGRSKKHLGCTIVNLSSNGAGALCPLREKLVIGDSIMIDMINPGTFEHISVVGEVKRWHKKGNAVFGGIQFQTLLTDNEFADLCEISGSS